MILAGQTISDRYDIRRRIGAGGMGEVFEAFDRDRAEIVALKTLARLDGETLARFKREFRALQTTSHPNLVSLRELSGDGASWFFTMELVRGEHFLEHVRRGPVTGGPPRCDEGRLRAALRQLVHGLRALHAAGLVHRDVKPSNVMVQPDGRVVLLDFGLVTQLDPRGQSVAAGPVGTVEYMSPEQAVGRAVGEASDWYAVGVMLYEALTGQMPHAGHALQILVEKQQVDPVSPAALAPDAPPDLVALCKDLLRIEPSARPDGAEVARRLGLDGTENQSSVRSLAGSAPNVFIGRERELAELAAAAARARERPVVHLVAGESGIGKSELVQQFVRRLADDDEAVLAFAGRCYERESVPYKALDGVADGLVQHLARLPDDEVGEILPQRPDRLLRLFPVFQRIEVVASAPASLRGIEPQEERRQMFGALRRLLRALGKKRRIVITIDDLQWADADSFLLLRELIRSRGAPPMLVLATVRGGEAEIAAIVEHLQDLAVDRTTLGPLSEAESRALAERLLPGASTRLDLARISREAGGHPMFLHELLRHLDQVRAHDGHATLDDALWSRVELLRDEARSVLELVCVAGAPISLETCAVACRLDAGTVARAAASLRVASLAREVQRGRRLVLEPYHDRVREAVGGRLDGDRRKDNHARLAAALETVDEPRDPQLLLRNFVLGGLPERAARYAEEAAERSEGAHAFDQAVALWRTALDIVPRDADDRRRVLLRLGQALINAGRGAEAAERFLAAAEGADRPTRLECHRHAAEQLIISGRIEKGMASLDALLGEIGVATPRTPRRALLSMLRHRALLRLRGLGFRERHRREIADADLVAMEVLKIAAHSLSIVDNIRGADFQSRQLLLALRTGYRPEIARALVLEGMFRATAGDLPRSKQLIARAHEVGIRPDEPYMKALLLGVSGMTAYFSGAPSRAIEDLLECEEAFRGAPGFNWEWSTAKLFRMFAMRWVGDYAQLRRIHDRHAVEAAHRGDRYIDSTMRRALVPMWLAEDDPAGALRELERATWVPPAGTFHVQHFHELLARGEIALYTGRAEDPAQLADMFERLDRSLLMRVESVAIQTAYLRGRLAAAHGDARGVTRAARLLEKRSTPVAHVWAHLLRGRFEDAAALAGTIGMRLTAAIARYRIAEASGASTTDAELAMIELGVRAPARMAQLLAPRATSGTQALPPPSGTAS